MNVLDFLTFEDRERFGRDEIFDATYAFNSAFEKSLYVVAPPGYYGLAGLRPKTGSIMVGSGKGPRSTRGTVFKQIDPAKPIIDCTSDASTGQITDIEWTNFRAVGADQYRTTKAFQSYGGGAPVVQLIAQDQWAVTNAVFEFYSDNVYQALKIIGPMASNVYNCRFKIVGEGFRGPAVETMGPYHNYDLFLTQCDSFCVIDSSDDSDIKVVGENCMVFCGQRNRIFARMEGVVQDRAASNTAITDGNFHNTYINPLVNLLESDIGKLQFAFRAFVGSVFINPQVIGEGAVSPLYPFADTYGPVTIIGGRNRGALLETYHSDPIGVDERKFERFTLVGENDGLTARAVEHAHLEFETSSGIFHVPPSCRSIAFKGTANPISVVQLELREEPRPGRMITIATSNDISVFQYGGVWGDVSALPKMLRKNSGFTMMYSKMGRKWIVLDNAITPPPA